MVSWTGCPCRLEAIGQRNRPTYFQKEVESAFERFVDLK
jgi:hypothetical protein